MKEITNGEATYMGKELRDLSREELYECINKLANSNNGLYIATKTVIMEKEQKELVEKLLDYFNVYIIPRTSRGADVIIKSLNKLHEQLNDCLPTKTGDLEKHTESLGSNCCQGRVIQEVCLSCGEHCDELFESKG